MLMLAIYVDLVWFDSACLSKCFERRGYHNIEIFNHSFTPSRFLHIVPSGANVLKAGISAVKK
jgi:hypothetical protein